MTYIPVQGGLGNQLFIFAMAHKIAAQSNRKVFLTFAQDKFNRDHRDNLLPIIAKNCSHGIEFRNGELLNFFLRAVDKIASLRPKLATNIKRLSHFEDFSNSDEYKSSKLENAWIVRGFFQSNELVEDQWSELEEEICSILNSIFVEFVSKQTNNENNDFENFQCIHIRRGDYVENSESIGLLTLKYFEEHTIKDYFTVITTDTLNSPAFKAKYKNSLFLDNTNSSPVLALALMAHSKRLIMSNSTLSYWGAKFALGNGAKVIGPEPWFKESHLIPHDYLKDERINYQKSIFE